MAERTSRAQTQTQAAGVNRAIDAPSCNSGERALGTGSPGMPDEPKFGPERGHFPLICVLDRTEQDQSTYTRAAVMASSPTLSLVR